MTVSELLSKADSQELGEWMAYYHAKAEQAPNQPQQSKKQSITDPMEVKKIFSSWGKNP